MAKPGPAAQNCENRLLNRLPRDEFQRLARLMRPVAFESKQILYHVRAPIDFVYFPHTGVVSAMTLMQNGSAIEVATIGNEGVSGLTALIGGETSPYEVMSQLPGHGLRMEVRDFRNEAQRAGPFRQALVLYNTAFALQVSYSVACNGLHTVEKRCCRWLLMTHDRVGRDDLPLTHELLAIMLGVRRASISEVLRPLQKQGVIHNGRGQIRILDRAGLEALACECYRAVTQEFARLFG